MQMPKGKRHASTAGKDSRTGAATAVPGTAPVTVPASAERFSLVSRAMARAIIAKMY